MFSSYSLWREFRPQVGLEEYHCHKKRGFSRARGKEFKVAALKNQDTIPQSIGKLAQKAIYYLYHHPEYLTSSGIEVIMSDVLKLSQKELEIQEQITVILQNYLKNPFLKDKKVSYIDSGETKPSKIKIDTQEIGYQLYYSFDCVLEEESQTIHIIDFKTGKNDNNYDLRQAFVYLLAGQHLYKAHKIIASFYHLETTQLSNTYNATQKELEIIKNKLGKIALSHNQEIKQYKSNPKLFDTLFPASPGKVCQQCFFTSICKDYAEYSDQY